MSHVYNSFPYCSKCGRSMGSMSTDEWQAMIDVDGIYPKCFDCSPDEADKIPSLFENWKPGDVFVLGDKSFMIAEHFGNGGEMFEIPSHARTPALSVCLSSSTKLNKHVLNDTVTAAAIETDAKCHHDTLVGHPFVVGLWTCAKCGWQLQEDESIILPAWVVGEGWRHTLPTSVGIHCDACLEVHIQGKGSYCAYHHALLTEQDEDATLGVGRE